MGTEYDYLGGAPDRVRLRTPEECEFLFIGGAGVGGKYLEGFKSAFDRAGIENVRVPNEGSNLLRTLSDAALVPSMNDLEFARSLVNAQPIKQAATHSRNLGEGEQYSLGGYSYGSAAAASQAYAIAENGGRVDNLVLVGSPINRDLYEAVKSHPNIKNVIEVDLAGQGDPIRPGMTDGQMMQAVPRLASQWRGNTGHFYYSGEGGEADRRRDELARGLFMRGVR
jgi:hypothetical protein